MFLFIDVQDVLEGERLEVEFVAGVVVGGNRFGVRVDHDGFPPKLSQGEGGVDAAVIKLDALPDAVRSPAKDHDFLLCARAGFVFVAVGRIIVGRIGFEFRRAGIDQTVGRKELGGLPGGPDVRLDGVGKRCDLTVGESELLGPAQIMQTVLRNARLLVDDLPDVLQKPWVNRGEFVNSLVLSNRPAAHGVQRRRARDRGCEAFVRSRRSSASHLRKPAGRPCRPPQGQTVRFQAIGEPSAAPP